MIPEVMEIDQPYDRLGPYRASGETHGHDYCRQNGHIYAWSDSNVRYELCWWLTPEGDPIAGRSEHVANLLRDRPFDKAWLK